MEDPASRYTYDMKKNPMMGGYLQKRLDRALYNLEDFAVSGVRMVGTAPVKRKDGGACLPLHSFTLELKRGDSSEELRRKHVVYTRFRYWW